MSKKPRVALCVTCLVDQFMHEIGVATVRLLRQAGCRVEFPAGQTCCGQPFFNSGFRPEAARLAQRTIDLFEPYEAVVLPSGSCTTMIRAEYPHLLEDDPKYYYQARRLAQKCYELSEFLTHQMAWSPVGGEQETRVQASADSDESESLTYHDSCHMCRLLQLRQEPRTVIERAGYQVREMAESDRCCGFGGLFSVRMPEVSEAMTKEKLRQAGQTGAKKLITADPGCLLQMRTVAGPEDVEIEHLATILAGTHE